MKYIAYCRKSTEDKDRQILSIESQIAELKEFAARENLQITEFVQEEKTAKIPGRAKFDEVVRRIEKGEIQGILAWHPDRLARNSIDGGRMIYLLDTGKLLDLKFPTFLFDNSPQGKFMLSISFGQSKYYVDNLSENIKRGLRQKLRKGIWPTFAPYGYLNNFKTKEIEIDPEKSRVVKRAFELFAEGNTSLAEICRFLYKFEMKTRSGKLLKIDSVKHMLTNTFYIGMPKYNGEFFEATHKTFISKELFQKVQRQVERIERPRRNGHNFAFSGLARCGECGAAITAESHIKFYKQTQRKAIYVYYRCTKKIKPCTQKFLPESGLDVQLREIVADAALPAGWVGDWKVWMDRDQAEEEKQAQENIIRLKEESESLERKTNLLLDAYLEGTVDQEVYKIKKNQLFEQKQTIKNQILEIQTNGTSWLEPMKEFVETASQLSKIARAKKNDEELAFFAKKVGSNFFLTNRRLGVEYRQAFAALSRCSSGRIAANNSCDLSLSVLRPGYEPG